MKIFILKLGGSVIAPKNAPRPFLRKKLLENIATALKESMRKENFRLVIIHGGGSFCHPLAKKFNLSKGTRKEKSRETAALRVMDICRTLNRRVTTILADHLPISLIDTPSIATNRDGKLARMDTKIIQDVLAQNRIPLLSGHVVPDETLGMSLTSGDRIAAMLSRELKAEALFFASDVDGIFESDPHLDKSAKQIKEILFHHLQNVGILSDAAHTDATGGMLEKFLPFFEAGMHTKRIHIFNGRNLKAFSMIADPLFDIGTSVRKEKKRTAI